MTDRDGGPAEYSDQAASRGGLVFCFPPIAAVAAAEHHAASSGALPCPHVTCGWKGECRRVGSSAEERGRIVEIVEKGPVRVVGIEVNAPWRELWTEVPKAWQLLRARAGEIAHRSGEVFLDVSVEVRDGVYRQIVGAEVSAIERVPEGMVGLEIPAQRYLRYRHEGTLEAIAESFAKMYAWGRERGHALDEFKLDVGYTLEGGERTHDLYVRVVP